MDSSVVSVINLSAYAIYFMLPAYLANVTALAFGGGKPLDFNHQFPDGAQNTWKRSNLERNHHWNPNWNYSRTFSRNNKWKYNTGNFTRIRLGGGALIGDACGSFIKRRLKLERGKPAPILDQLDFVVGALVFASLIVVIPVEIIVVILVISVFLHLGANIIAYLLGMKNVWY